MVIWLIIISRPPYGHVKLEMRHNTCCFKNIWPSEIPAVALSMFSSQWPLSYYICMKPVPINNCWWICCNYTIMSIIVRLLLRGGSGQCRCLSYAGRGFRFVCSGRLHCNNLCITVWVYLHEHVLSSATEYHLGLLKAKLAKYRAQLLEPTGKAGAKVRFVKQSIAQPYLSTFWLIWDFFCELIVLCPRTIAPSSGLPSITQNQQLGA